LHKVEVIYFRQNKTKKLSKRTRKIEGEKTWMWGNPTKAFQMPGKKKEKQQGENKGKCLQGKCGENSKGQKY